MIRSAVGLALLLTASPALAQHAGHVMPPGMTMDRPKPAPKPAAKPSTNPPARQAPKAAARAKPRQPTTASRPARSTPPAAGPMDHTGTADVGGMDMGETDGDEPAAQPPGDAAPMDHSAMDHGSMMTPTARGDAPSSEAPPPPAAGRGPARAADDIWGAEAMRASRDQLAHEQGGQLYSFFMADRAELRSRSGRDGYLWDLQGYYGGDLDKLWVKSEGEGSFGERIGHAELQALWSHAITPWFDAQLGVRQDFAGPDRTHLAAGVQGLAPYLFEVDAAAFLSQKGDLTARVEVELDQRITQRLRLQPRAEVDLAAQEVRELGIGAGLGSVELGLRLRYEIVREFAPYIGIAQEWRFGGSRDFLRARGGDLSVTNVVAGVRLWF